MIGTVPPRTSARLALIALFAVIVAVAWVRHGPPECASPNAPGSFDGPEAWQSLVAFVGDGAPRDPGSIGHESAITRLREAAARCGVAFDSQRFMARGWKRTAVEMHNLFVVVPDARGSTDGPLVLLNAHYDGVPMGPGAGDNAVGVACALEILRALKAAPAACPVVVLLSDGEELGLLGAREFAKENPLWKRVVGVVNLDARGSDGPVHVFETGAHGSWHAAILAGSDISSRATSLASEAYQHMPNGTDFTVFRMAGAPGFNLAFIGSPHNYHTANDTVERVDPRTLAQMGTDALALVRALAAFAHDPQPSCADSAVWFDFYSIAIFWWPSWVSWTALSACVALLVTALVRLRAEGMATLGGTILVAWMSTTGLMASVIAGGLLTIAIRTAHPSHWPWPDGLWAGDLALVAVGFACVTMPVSWISRRRRHRRDELVVAWDDSLGAWGVAAAVTLVALAFAPGAVHPLLIPLGVASVSGAALAIARPSRASPSWVGLAGAGAFLLMWVPLEGPFVDAFGLSLGGFTAMRGALLALSCRGVLR